MLPVKGVTFIMGNDIAGGKVVPVLEVLDKSDHSLSNELAQSYPHVFPACAVTRAQARQEQLNANQKVDNKLYMGISKQTGRAFS
jgi:hypothetical protein